MNKNALAYASLVAAVLALSACGDSSPEAAKITPAPVEPAIDTASPTATQPQRSPRGNILKAVGEPGGNRVTEGGDEWALNFTLTDIAVDPACTAPFATPAENGHLVAISIDATTIQEPEFTETMFGSVSFDSHNWKVIAPNGTTVNTITSAASIGCLPESDRMPFSIGAAEKVTGKIVLDVPAASGTLVYAPNGSTGWEWEYGAE